MRVERVELADWGAWTRCAVELGPGINVLHGANGVGKSTLLGALARALFERHGTRAATVMDVVPWGSRLAPRTTVTFVHADTRWRIAKQFVTGAHAVLERELSGFQRVAEGRAADDELRAILGVSEPTAGGARTPEWGIFEMLWAMQGALSPPDALNAPTQALLRECAGDLVEPPEARAAGERILRARALELKANGQPRAHTPLDRLRREVERLGAERAQLAVRLDDASGRLTRLAELADQADAATARLARLEAERERALARDAGAAERARRTRELELALSEAHARAEALGLRLRRLADLARRLDDASRASGERERELARAGADVAAATAHEERAARHQVQLETGARDAELRVRRADALARRTSLVERAARARAAADDRAAAQRSLEALALPGGSQRSAIEALIGRSPPDGAEPAPRVVLAIEARLPLLLRGPGEAAERAIAQGEVCRLELGPGEQFALDGICAIRAAPQSDRASELAAQCDTLLGAGPVRSVEQLSADLRAAAELERAIGGLDAECRALVPQGLEALAAELARVEAELAAYPPPTGDPGPGDPGPTGFHSALETESARARDAAHAGRAAQLTAARRTADLRVVAERARTRAEELEAERERDASELASLRAAEPDPDGLDRRLDAARRDLAALSAEKAALERAREEDRQAAVAQGQLGQRIERERTQQTARLAEIERLRGAVDELFRSGGSEELERIEASLADAERDRAREELRARGLALLAERYTQERERAIDRVALPVSARVLDAARSLGLEIEGLALDASLVPMDLRVAPDTRVELRVFSQGERAQVHALIRLELAELFARRGPRLVVLDDPFVHCDQARCAALCARLERLPPQTQVLLATCHPDRFASLAGARWIDLATCGTLRRKDP